MIVRFVIWSTVLCLCLVGRKAEVTVQNRAYHDVLISFAPNVEAKDGKLLVDSLQVVLEDTSKVLYKAVGYRISSVTFLLPRTWDLSSWEIVSVTMSQSREVPSDVVVDAAADSAFGQYPFSLQHGGCGVPGQPITVPVEFLKDHEQSPSGKLVAREWLKYRYGVFDENGFDDDTMYPSSYTIPGTTDLQVTECTDPKLEYIFKDSDGNNCTSIEATLWGNCTLVPEEEAAGHVNSSLMYFHKDLPNVEEVCGREHPHNDLSPNKHNILCSGKSVWDVLQTSSDFESDETSDDYVKTEFSFIQEDHPRILVAWETSESLFDKGNFIAFGVQRFFYDLPEHSKCAFYSFDDNMNEILPLTELSPPDQRQLEITPHFVFNKKVCTSCAVFQAVDVLQTQGSAILIVGSSSSEVDTAVIDKLKDSEICLTIIVFSDDESVAASYEALRAASPCGSIHRIPMSDQGELSFEKLYEAMHSAVPQSPTDTRTRTVETGAMSPNGSIDFSSDPTAKEFTIWLAKPLPANNIACKEGDNVVTLNVAIRKSIASYSLEAFDSEVKCLLTFPRLEPVFTHVQMTTKPGEYFVEDVWVWDTTQEQDKDQRPVIIYAKLHFGKYPIRYARVLAKVSTTSGNEVQVQLFDSGLGDPDVTQNDGIYSGYFMDFDAKGEYQVQVSINDSDGQARMGRNGSERCCGRRVKSEEFEVHSFQRTLQTTFMAIGGKPNDGYPPSRVTDLRIVQFDPTKSILLEWTAPGGGKAHNYTIKTFTSREDAVKNFTDSGHSLNSTFITPGSEGNPETFEFEVLELEPNATHYVVVRSANENGVTSESSNILVFFISEDEVASTVETTTDAGNDKARKSAVNKETIGIVVGVLAIVVVICIYLVVHFLVIKPKRKKGKSKVDENGPAQQRRSNIPPGASFGLNSIPADVIIKHHNEVVNAKNEHKDPPIFKEENLDSIHSTPSLPENTNRNRNAEYTNVQKRLPDTEVSGPDSSKPPKRMTVV